MKIEALPSEDRPREKALAMGVSSLTDAEILALLLGKGTVGASALEIAQRLLSEYGGLSSLSKASRAELSAYPGVKTVKALTLLGVFELARRVKAEENEPSTIEYRLAKIRSEIGGVEELFVLLLDKKKRVRSCHLAAKGDGDGVIYSGGEVLRYVLSSGCSRFVLVHAHPSEYCLPSPEDVRATSQLALEAKRFHCELIDHVILTKGSDFSFEKNGLLH